MTRIAIIGAGIFGTTCAIRLASKGHDCILFEKEKEILSCASRVNQYRFHRGYHYPRASETVNQLKNTQYRFQEEYGAAIDNGITNIYALAKEKSLVNFDQYINFLKTNSLKYKILDDYSILKREMFSGIFEVEEGLINFTSLKKLINYRIKNYKNIKVKLKTSFDGNLADKFDFVIICTYGLSSNLLPKEMRKNYKYQLIEKPVVKPHVSLKNKSIVVIDGPFMCIDPLLGSDYSLLGNVKHAIHQTSFGLKPEPIPSSMGIIPWTDIKNQSKSKFKDFIDDGKLYIKNFEKCKFKFSMTGYRVVNIKREKTDDRPTYINYSNKFIEISSGKIDTCSWTADQISDLIDSKF